jgi:hypothetical protein
MYKALSHSLLCIDIEQYQAICISSHSASIMLLFMLLRTIVHYLTWYQSHKGGTPRRQNEDEKRPRDNVGMSTQGTKLWIGIHRS